MNKVIEQTEGRAIFKYRITKTDRAVEGWGTYYILEKAFLGIWFKVFSGYYHNNQEASKLFRLYLSI